MLVCNFNQIDEEYSDSLLILDKTCTLLKMVKIYITS